MWVTHGSWRLLPREMCRVRLRLCTTLKLQRAKKNVCRKTNTNVTEGDSGCICCIFSSLNLQLLCRHLKRPCCLRPLMVWRFRWETGRCSSSKLPLSNPCCSCPAQDTLPLHVCRRMFPISLLCCRLSAGRTLCRPGRSVSALHTVSSDSRSYSSYRASRMDRCFSMAGRYTPRSLCMLSAKPLFSSSPSWDTRAAAKLW